MSGWRAMALELEQAVGPDPETDALGCESGLRGVLPVTPGSAWTATIHAGHSLALGEPSIKINHFNS